MPELHAAWITDLLQTAQLMATLLSERTGRDPGDPRVRAYTGAVMGAIMAAMVPMLEDPAADFIGDVDAALDCLEGGLRL